MAHEFTRLRTPLGLHFFQADPLVSPGRRLLLTSGDPQLKRDYPGRKVRFGTKRTLGHWASVGTVCGSDYDVASPGRRTVNTEPWPCSLVSRPSCRVLATVIFGTSD